MRCQSSRTFLSSPSPTRPPTNLRTRFANPGNRAQRSSRRSGAGLFVPVPRNPKKGSAQPQARLTSRTSPALNVLLLPWRSRWGWPHHTRVPAIKPPMDEFSSAPKQHWFLGSEHHRLPFCRFSLIRAGDDPYPKALHSGGPVPILIGPIAVDGCEWNREPSRAATRWGWGMESGYISGGRRGVGRD